jgi:hypothetical protein
MQNTKIVQLLQSLSVYEQKRFRKYLCSPLHNEEENYIKLFDILHPGLSDQTILIGRVQIQQTLFPKKKLTNLDFARLFSNFSRRLEGFLALEQYYADPVRPHTDVLTAYNERNLGKYFPDFFHYVKKLNDKTQQRSGEFYLNTFKIEVLHHDHLEAQQERSTNKNLLETLSALDNYYLITKLRFCAAMLHYQAFLSLKGEVPLLNEILHYCAKKEAKEPLLNAYYLIVLSLIEPNEEAHFKDFKKNIFAEESTFPSETERDLFAFAINYCINRINSGHTLYQREIFELYQMALQKKILFPQGELSPWDFKNIVTIALRNKEYSWTEHFIETYKNTLPRAERSNAYTFNRARYFFAIKNYDKVLQLLQNVDYSDIFYLLDSKTTLMKTYFELNEYQPLLSLKESFRILLRRKKLISEQNKTNYDNFARFTMKLFRINVSDRKALNRLKNEITNTGNIADKSWIMEKLQERIAD